MKRMAPVGEEGGPKSGRLLAQALVKSLEQPHRVVRSGTRLGVVLDGPNGQLPVGDPFDGLVVEVEVSDFHRVGESVGIHGEGMVLGGDMDATASEIPDGMVATVVPELHLEGFGAQDLGKDLMPKANPEGRHGVVEDEFADGLDEIGDSAWISGSVGEEDPFGACAQDVLGLGVGGDNPDVETGLHQAAEDVSFDAAVHRDNGNPGTRGMRKLLPWIEVGEKTLVPVLLFFAGDFLNEVTSFQGGALLAASDQFFVAGLRVGGEEDPHGSACSDLAGQKARVHLVDGHDSLVPEIGREGGSCSVVARDPAHLSDNEPCGPGPAGLVVPGRDPVVSDQGVGHEDDLSVVAGVGQDLLVAAQSGVEDEFPGGLSFGSGRTAQKDGSIF